MHWATIGNAGLSGIEGKFKFVPLPMTEVEADADSYVCEFNGAANANEVGVGGGLSGADLILTQYGGVGTDGVNRVITNGTFQSFYVTMPFCNNFAQSSAGVSILFRNKNLNGANVYLANLRAQDSGGNPALGFEFYQKFSRESISSVSDNSVSGEGVGVAIPPSVWPAANTPYQALVSFDYVSGLAFGGLRVDDGKFPTKLNDFLFFSINQFAPYSGPNAITQFEYSNYYKCIVGSFATSYNNNYSGGQTMVSLTMSKKPCYVPV